MDNIIQIDGKDFNLTAAKIEETPNSEQLAAVNHLVNFLKSDKKSSVLSGSAGTGKTFSTKILLAYMAKKLPDYDIVLAAPTHKAKVVLSRLSKGGEATTLHKLLGLSPIVNIIEFDARNIDFTDKYALDFLSNKTLFIIDESSMINDILYGLIITKLCTLNNKVLFLGDKKQLKPVKQNDEAKVFNATDDEGFDLTTVVRQKSENSLKNYLIKLREDKVEDFETEFDNNGGLIRHTDTISFMSEIINKVKTVNLKTDPFAFKVLCYTNARVDKFNQTIRRLMGYKEPFVKGEVLMGYDSFSLEETTEMCIKAGVINDPFYSSSLENSIASEIISGKSRSVNSHTVSCEIFNSNDYVILKSVKAKKEIPFFSTVDGYYLILLDTVDNSKHLVFIIDPELETTKLQSLINVMEGIRLQAVDKRNSNYVRKKYWTNWYKMRKSFANMKDMVYDGRIIKKAALGYGYAISVHKSQGSTYENVYVDMANILTCPNPADIRPLQYVALSRPQKFAHVLI